MKKPLDRSEAAVNAGRQVMQGSTKPKMTAKTNLKLFPTDQEIEAFQA